MGAIADDPNGPGALARLTYLNLILAPASLILENRLQYLSDFENSGDFCLNPIEFELGFRHYPC